MKDKGRARAAIGTGIVIFIVTLAVFFLGYTSYDKGAMDWLALMFVVISEIALFAGTVYILTKRYTDSQMLMASALISTLSVYWLGTVILSIFSRKIFNDNIRGFATTQIIVAAITIIILIPLYLAVSKVREIDTKLMNSGVVMRECERLAFSLKSNNNFSEYYSLLNKIYEEIKYSDKTQSIDSEQDIYNKIEELSKLLSSNIIEQKAQDIEKITDEIILRIKERNFSVSQLKHS